MLRYDNEEDDEGVNEDGGSMGLTIVETTLEYVDEVASIGKH